MMNSNDLGEVIGVDWGCCWDDVGMCGGHTGMWLGLFWGDVGIIVASIFIMINAF